ncbi:hypothetical protein MNBD_NITROSPIRAE01-2127 [hydrothermal vent metagenome]|uniref:non-specific protein-tyrosine kinase n=1 Tax=hydrothermal vent metagenome TaxID=652676 RepID=A0A3B1CZY2_9ZZZZ
MKSRASKDNAARQGIIVLNEATPFITDRYRLLFAKIDLISRKQGKKVIAITSSIKGEGKTTTTSNLAVVSARDFGKRVLIIDGDYKNPSLARRFEVNDDVGLVNVIAEECTFSSAVQHGPVKNLSLLTMGRESNSRRVQMRHNENAHIWAENGILSILQEVRDWFDYIWVDAPPILPLFDMSVISEAVDGVVLVVKTGVTPEAVLTQAVKSLGSDKVIGSVLNYAKTSWKYGYDRYHYEYDHYDH